MSVYPVVLLEKAELMMLKLIFWTRLTDARFRFAALAFLNQVD